MTTRRLLTSTLCVMAMLSPWTLRTASAAGPNTGGSQVATATAKSFKLLRLAITHLSDTFGERYPHGPEYLARLDALEAAARPDDPTVDKKFQALQQAALLDNPLLDFDRLMLLKRKRGQLGLPTNHQCNACLKHTGYDNEIAVLSPVRHDGKLQTLFRPPQGFYVGEIDLHFDGERLLFTMPNGKSWEIHEIRIDGSGLRRVTRGVDGVDNFDACYLPNGRIVFASTASFTAVPCWHGKERACNLYRMNADGSGVRQLCFDQDLDLHPAVLPSGQVIYSRWDYSGTMHMYLRPLMAMNPDGTAQRAVYGSNSYYPNALYFPRGIPDAPNKLVAVLAGYHGVNRMGELAVLDVTRGWYEADGIVARVGHRGEAAVPVVRDRLIDHSWPKFLHPYPLSEQYFITAAQLHGKAPWGIYLVDVFDNMVPLQVDPRFDFFEPIPIRKTGRPPIVPDRVDLTRDDAVIYLHDVYVGPGLAGVPRGSVKRLRLVAYHFGYPGLAGPDKIGCGGPWEVMRILGTVPVYEDGSAHFRVPANTPLTIQPLDAEGKALQLMRSWYTAMPGEVGSCVGCHEQPKETPLTRHDLAATRPPSEIEPWYGPPRGFDFEREVQPVLDRYCVSCHDGRTTPDLRAEGHFPDYRGRPLTKLGANRLHADLVAYFGGKRVRYTPAYEALIPFIRRVGIEDDVHLLVPGEYHADTSELVQMLQKGHHGVELDAEAWDRLITWIDLNGPCHGTWNDVGPIPGRPDRRRWELMQLYGGPAEDFEADSKQPRPPVERAEGDSPIFAPRKSGQSPFASRKSGQSPTLTSPEPSVPKLAGWPLDADEARRRQTAGPWRKTVDLGGGITLDLVRIPAGRFVMGQADGRVDELPPHVVSIERDFWIGACEVTNAQFRRFDPKHRSGNFMKRYPGIDGPGLPLDGPNRPAVRVSWQQAMAFCRWLSETSGVPFTLPSEAQWEYACRAGSATALSYGPTDADASAFANLADRSLATPPSVTGGLTSSITTPHITGIMLASVDGGDIPCTPSFDDRSVATADVAGYRPNAWGLYDAHGNAAEWTLSTYAPYPYRDDGRNASTPSGRKVVRGGSFRDRPKRCRSAFRLSYPAWQRVHNVGFRVATASPIASPP